MKYKWKKRIALSLVICLFCMSTTGCASAPAAENELDAPEPINDETNETKQDEGTDAENTSETSGKWKVYEPDVAAAIDADFEGSVSEINADSFSILPIETSLLEDGSLLTVETAPDVEISDGNLVKVVFDDNTVFTLRDIYDGGARHEDSDASFKNVEKGVTVSLKGEFQNDIFHARTIRIIKVHS